MITRMPLNAPARFAFSMLVVVSASGAWLRSEPPATRPANDEPQEVQLSVGRAGEYDGLIADLALAGDQLDQFRARDTQRLEDLKSFVESADGKALIELREQLAAARRAKKPASDIEALRAKIKPLSDKYWAVRTQGRVALLELLNEAQQKRYIGLTLFQRALRKIAQDEFTQEQRNHARTIADEEAAKWYTPQVIKSDPYFRGLQLIEDSTAARIAKEVLKPTKS